jgi:hypothetical protein
VARIEPFGLRTRRARTTREKRIFVMANNSARPRRP